MGKIGARCQVCDGPISNGRCKLCGMPYRNDEVLYHLNENKEEHYKHASAKAKKIMRDNQVPLGDKPPAAVGKEKAAKAKQPKKSAADQWMQQNTAKAQDAGKSASTAKAGTNGGKVYTRTGNTTKSSSQTYSTATKKDRKSRIFWIIMLLVMIFGSVGADVAEFVQDTFFNVVESTSVQGTSAEIPINKILK